MGFGRRKSGLRRVRECNAVAVIDTQTSNVADTIPIGQSPQALVYLPNAVPRGNGSHNLVPLGVVVQSAHLKLADSTTTKAQTTAAVNSQELVDLLEAAVTGLEPRSTYVFALATNPDG
ncbi:MAG: hypothetical protein C4325_11365 [Blastocatellia bacterium]